MDFQLIMPTIAMTAKVNNLLAPCHITLATSENWHNVHYLSVFCSSIVSQELNS